jgi:protein-arginine kinase activator protein McsA
MVTTLEDLKETQLTVKETVKRYPNLILEAYKNAQSYSHLLDMLNITKTNTRARETIKQFLKTHNLPLLEYNRDFTKSPKALTKEEILTRLVKSDKHYGTALRKWIITFKLLPYRCNTLECVLHDEKNVLWNGKLIILDLDHINGDNKDNRIENLRFLCPNCHSQTETYKGLNNRKKSNSANFHSRRTTKVSNKMICPECGEEKSVRSKTCENCYSQPFKVAYPSISDLITEIKASNFEAVGRTLGVTGNTIRKHLRRNNINPKTLLPVE